MAGWTQLFAWISISLCLSVVRADPALVVDPNDPGPDTPPQGRSLFDQLTTQNGRQHIPFPFQALLDSIENQLANDDTYLDRPIKKVLIPLGRSLQRDAAAPDYFASPRVVVAVDSEPREQAHHGGMLLRDRLFIGYLESADVLEIISYNDEAARFEFQVVGDYRRGNKPKVRYARRAVCTACHQNAAPIFARPLWDETNANMRIADQLSVRRGEFYGILPKTGVDVAYAIDNATDRANEFSLTQLLWRRGCGSGDQGAACRAAALARAIQYALTAGRGFDQSTTGYSRVLAGALRERFATDWPDGLALPDADIPNRKPLAGASLGPSNNWMIEGDQLIRLADVSAQVEPLEPRAPKTVWKPTADDAAQRLISGIADFLAHADTRRLSKQMARRKVTTSNLRADCRIESTTQASKSRMKIRCDGADVKLNGIVYHNLNDSTLSGRLRQIRIGRDELNNLSVRGVVKDEQELRLLLSGSTDDPVRLVSGDALGSLVLDLSNAQSNKIQAELHVRHDFQWLEDEIENLARDPNGVFAERTFNRTRVLDKLYRTTGIDVAWCCDDAGEVPPATTEQVVTRGEDPLITPFLQVCATCHRSDDPFPPNFLAGSTREISRAIGQCAERIQYRLAMWDFQHRRRSKSPMPPRALIGLSDSELDTWTTGPLLRLRNALYEIAAREIAPLPTQQQLLSRNYTDLRPCLAAS